MVSVILRFFESPFEFFRSQSFKFSCRNLTNLAVTLLICKCSVKIIKVAFVQGFNANSMLARCSLTSGMSKTANVTNRLYLSMCNINLTQDNDFVFCFKYLPVREGVTYLYLYFIILYNLD